MGPVRKSPDASAARGRREEREQKGRVTKGEKRRREVLRK